MASGAIHVGIGGWSYEPWCGTFYPPKLPHARELEFASRQVTAIEINATFYRLQKPESFARWREATPPGFAFTVKGSRYCSNRRALGEAGEGIAGFLSQGLTERARSSGRSSGSWRRQNGSTARRLPRS